ncbi:olfactory receptor 1361-like [Rhinatrema bivittatum]|uniref:olfactory receptor 1361-like n=1 Tax=Rhinatrema bivittatum TaxID=194408 RepID=UPI001127CC68|nr:olfactory receptor 1361-like [Rhinatrema bivittatum]
MSGSNKSFVTEFILLGFSVTPELQPLMASLFLFMYLLTIAANLLIIGVVRLSRQLHTPMYFFIGNFSFLEIWYTSVTVPKLLAGLITGNKTISVHGCIAQFYLLFVFGSTENFLLAVMAYDRYLAICNPLHYATVMTGIVCICLAVGSWVAGLLAPLMPAILISMSVFCGSQEIDHFYCDFPPLLRLSCITNPLNEVVFFALACIVILGCFVSIMVSYAYIISAILRISSSVGRQRAFSTCASHLAVVGIFYGSLIFMYIRPSASHSSQLDKVVSVFYCVVTPVLNPVIYSLRNKEVKNALCKPARHFLSKNFPFSRMFLSGEIK